MDFEKLVDMITKEVAKRLSDLNFKEESMKKETVVILATTSYKEIEENLNNKYDIRYFDEGLRECDKIIIPRTCIKLLSNLANGICSEEMHKFISIMLLKGKKVYMMEDGIEYKKYRERAPKALLDMYEGFEEKIKTFGINIISSLDEIEGNINKEESLNESSERIGNLCSDNNEENFLFKGRKLITESDLRKIYMKGVKEVSIDKKALITPLASDFVRIHQLIIKRV
ncbi:TIGR02536 family ethanolamine utilization protein [Clostridium sporogenes]|uniref:TIGR02536 family ethanolamine utilization protein n=1 Tax=Clostridium sporogenes TaxID=1509 RepID=A0AAE4FHE8_CLOSG|nr:TIGR02536 family ethanolamine utilization protein [Clostridium sporogenes]MDS1002325.1 TIGR02536 family ethanolamine utilization protein [Clostridium sporogenes]